jgi:hypothetical protein
MLDKFLNAGLCGRPSGSGISRSRRYSAVGLGFGMSRLSHLSNFFGRVVRSVLGFVLGFCLLLAFLYYVLLQIYPNLPVRIADFLRPPSNGLILVTSPTVYTRQRLVNDRLAQTSWLQEQLEVTKGSESEFRPLDRITNVSSVRLSNSNLQLEGKGAQQAESPKSDNQAQDVAKDKLIGREKNKEQPDASSSAEISLLPTSSTVFQAKNSFRDEVRAEMMEAQLDDRHDIQGNTIYRLSFNVSVLPTPENNGLALIFVRLRRDFKEEYFHKDDENSYVDWLRHVQRVADESVPNIIYQLRFNSTERYSSSIPIFVVKRLCEWLKGNTDESCFPGRPSPSQQLAKRILKHYRAEYLTQRLRTDISNNIKLAAAHNKKLRVIDFLHAAESPRSLSCVTKGNVNQGVNIRGNTDKSAVMNIECPIDDPAQGVLSAVALYSKLATLEPTSLGEEALLSKLLENFQPPCSKDDLVLCANSELTEGQLRCFAADYLKASLNKEMDLLEPRKEQLMEHFLRLAVVGQEVENCSLLVQPRPEGVELLRHYLNNGVEVFTYSVTPRNLAQRASLLSKRSEGTDISLNGRAVALAGSVNGLVQRLVQHATTSQSIDATPIVVGFSVPKKESPPAPSNDGASKETSFGWVIAPQLTGDGDRQQVDREYPVSAVVSLPAWWRSIRLDITTCWIPRSELNSARRVNECKGAPGPDNQPRNLQGANDSQEMIRLPGAIAELSSKLGFEIVQEPHLKVRSGKDNRLRAEVGRPFDLLLTGFRIWRSTEVTLGSQKADEIVVLPNMEGIVAHFNCVEPQMAIPDQKDLDVDILVWTSEGVTEPEFGKLVVPPWLQKAAAERKIGDELNVCPKNSSAARKPVNLANGAASKP